jgi:hypothetical protein
MIDHGNERDLVMKQIVENKIKTSSRELEILDRLIAEARRIQINAKDRKVASVAEKSSLFVKTRKLLLSTLFKRRHVAPVVDKEKLRELFLLVSRLEVSETEEFLDVFLSQVRILVCIPKHS